MEDSSQFKATILVIDSDPNQREGICDLLELDNYHVLAADNGADGLLLAQEHKPDLIICKFSLPRGYAGDAMLEKWQSMPETAAIPIIWTRISSQHRDPTGQIYLRVPFDPDDLFALVRAALKVDQ